MKRSIVAFDLGSNMAAVWNTGDVRHAVFQVLTGNRSAKLAQVQDFLHRVCPRDRPDAVFYERPFCRGLAATRLLWGIAGALDAWAYVLPAPVVDMSPSPIKKWATLDGRASKETMMLAAQRLGYGGDNEHVADAWCAHAYAHAKIEWPGEK